MTRKLSIYGVFAIVSLLFVACSDDPVTNTQEATPQLPDEAFNYVGIWDELEDFKLPSSFPDGSGNFISVDNCIGCFEEVFGNFNQNVVDNNEVATLGRVLFYDTNLSQNKSISCASCHKQEKAFADDKASSIGFAGKLTERNSMSLANPVTNNSFFWDSRVSSLKELVVQPIENHVELGFTSMDDLVNRLNGIDYYDELFTKAYGSSAVNSERVNDAIAQFIGSMFSGRAKFDEGVDNNFADYTELEKIGMGLFFSDRTKCNRCHAGANFSSPDFPGGEYGSSDVAGTANIGLDINYQDEGRGNGKFRIPSLRNIGLTAPYMHDGRFETLSEVLDHYDSDIAPHQFLDDNLKVDGNTPNRMNLTELEKIALEAFLNTLSDKDLVSNPKYSNPFRS